MVDSRDYSDKRAADSALHVTVLKNLRWGNTKVEAGTDAPALPYRIDHLAGHGLTLHTTDVSYAWPWRRLHDPTVQTLAMAPGVLRHPAVLAMLESSVHPLGLLRRVLPAARRPALVVVSCWLTELVTAADRRKLDLYRAAYSTVDRLFCFSRDQVPVLGEALGLPDEKVVFLPFGIDHEEFCPAQSMPEGPILVAGRDKGRDWPTALAALRASGVTAQIICRPRDLAGLDVPDNVEVIGYVDRHRYRSMLQRARAVLVITNVRKYPTGQSVLLEAMACGRPVIATQTPALGDYLEPGVTALTVPPHDVEALVEAIGAINSGSIDTVALGQAGRRAVEDRFNARAMWAQVAADLHHLLAARSR